MPGQQQYRHWPWRCHPAFRALPPGPRSLEELSEKRQSMLQRVKAAQKERDALSGDKAAAEEYLARERECLGAQSVLAQVLTAKARVGDIEPLSAWRAGCPGVHVRQTRCRLGPRMCRLAMRPN